MKKAIIIGATSGIGQEVAKCLLLDGWQIGVAGRRQSALENLQRAAPDQIQIQALDVTQEDAGEKGDDRRGQCQRSADRREGTVGDPFTGGEGML